MHLLIPYKDKDDKIYEIFIFVLLIILRSLTHFSLLAFRPTHPSIIILEKKNRKNAPMILQRDTEQCNFQRPNHRDCSRPHLCYVSLAF